MNRKLERFDVLYAPVYDEGRGAISESHAAYVDRMLREVSRRLQSLGYVGVFDAVLCVDALENLPPEDWPAALTALRGAAKPAAPVYLTVELPEGIDLDLAYDTARAKGWPVVPGELAEDDGYHYYPSRDTVLGWLDDAGLEIVEQSDGDGYWHLLLAA